jgi:phosphatidylglycerophosphatase C
MSRAIALFDFDATLVKGDSLPTFVACCVGWPRTILTALFAALVTVCAADRRTAFKALWLRLSLRDFPLDKMPDVLARLEAKLRWIASTKARLDWHKERGDIIVIASGGLDLYLSYIMRSTAPDYFLCTTMAVMDGKLTGIMQGGNCVRQEKARRAKELLTTLSPQGEIWAYGNLPHDLPMMELATHRVVV